MIVYRAVLLLVLVLLPAGGVASAGVVEEDVLVVPTEPAPGAEDEEADVEGRADEEARDLAAAVQGHTIPTTTPAPVPAPAPAPANAETKMLSPFQCVPPGCIPGVPLTRSPTPRPTPPTLPPPPRAIQGYGSCRYGDADCNVCANDVEETFLKAFGDPGMSSKNWVWHLYWNNKYRPAGTGAATGGFGVDPIYEHIQGFVRTNNDTIRYAAAHSNVDGARGGYYFVEKTSKRNNLYAMHLAETSHPNSVAEIGQYVVSGGDDTDAVRFFDLRKIKESQNVLTYVPGIDSGGGIGMAKMADGSYLLVANTHSGQEDRYLQMYRWVGPLTSPTSVTLLSSSKYSQPSTWTGNYKSSDNLSLIVECGTGQLFTIHSGGDEDYWNFVSDGWWRLSRVDWDASTGKPVHKTLHGRGVKQDKRNCHLRSSGTVHVTRDHKLEFYCHERNIIHGLLSHDTWDFTLKQPN